MESHRDEKSLLKSALDRIEALTRKDEELQRLPPPSDGQGRLLRECRSSIECLSRACELFARRPCFGERAFEVIEGGDEPGTIRALPSFQRTTYAELWKRVEALASGLRAANMADTGLFVGICGFGSVDWVVADLACLYLAAISVPLQTSAALADLRNIVNEARLGCIVCSLRQIDRVASLLPDCPSVRSLVVIDVNERSREDVEALALARQALLDEHGARVAVSTIAEVTRLGRERGLVPYVEPEHRAAAEPDPLMTLMYTSGSTGAPKGAMFPESLWLAFWRAPSYGRFPAIPHVSVNYMPLNHMAGRAGIIRSIREGGLTHFVSASDMSTLFEDIQLARPTSLMLIPRASGMIYQRFQTELVQRAAARGIDRHDEAERARIGEEIMAEMRRSFLGDRLVYAMAGTAPTAPEVSDFIERCFEVPLFDAYGSTEAGPITFEDRIMTEVVTDWKLVSVPELGYRTTDAPYPRGELCVRTTRLVPGYYKNPEATGQLFDAEGYLMTGDVVEQRGPEEIVWIDRKKNVLKLAQGEFVNPTRLEELYATGSPYLRQVYIHGNSLQSYLLAVIVPERSAVDLARASGALAAGDAAQKALIREELNRIALDAQVASFEIPRDFLVEREPFSQEQGLLTESNKQMRPRLRARYGEELDRLYAAIERRQLSELEDLAAQKGADASVADRVIKAMAVTLGVSSVDVTQAVQSFIQLGGDSLSSARLADLLRDLCGVSVPVGLLLDPTLRVSALIRYVEERAAGRASPRNVTFAQVHGEGARTVKAEDLRLDRFLGPEDFEAARKATPATARPPEARVSLLTGANGFLGRFLLLELLERAAVTGGEVVCLVRAPSDAAARERLHASYQGPDPALWSRFQALAAGRLTVLQGDLMKSRLGLPDEVFARLADEVDSVVHNGALVNHALSYAQLFEPNVLGTVELMRFAITRRIKAFSFVSTVGVAAGLGQRGPIREDEDAASLHRESPVDSGYAVGYATSKWACEILLRELASRCGVPVSIQRCSMIMAHRDFVGQVNLGDFLTRLLYGVIVTGAAPRSFYASAAQRPHFDGLPVDFVARAITTIASVPLAGCATYHVVNARWDDGVSLDTLVDWVQAAGYPVTRFPDYAAFFAELGARLRALPPDQQQRSPLPILYQWAQPIRPEAETLFDARRLRARLSELAAGPVTIPRVDEALIRVYLKDLAALGLIGAPPAVGKRATG